MPNTWRMATPEAPRTTAPARDPLFSPLLQRIAAASGIVFVVLAIASIVVSDAARPEFDASPQEYAAFASEHADDVQLGTLLLLLGIFQLVWFVGYLSSELARAEIAARGFARIARISFAGGVIGAAGLATTVLAGAAAVSEPADTDPGLVRALMHLDQWLFLTAAVGFAVWLQAGGMLIIRTRVLPVWLGAVAMLGGLGYVITLFSVLAPEDDGGAAGIGYPVGFLALLIFVLVSSILLVRRVGREPEPAGGAARV